MSDSASPPKPRLAPPPRLARPGGGPVPAKPPSSSSDLPENTSPTESASRSANADAPARVPTRPPPPPSARAAAVLTASMSGSRPGTQMAVRLTPSQRSAPAPAQPFDSAVTAALDPEATFIDPAPPANASANTPPSSLPAPSLAPKPIDSAANSSGRAYVATAPSLPEGAAKPTTVSNDPIDSFGQTLLASDKSPSKRPSAQSGVPTAIHDTPHPGADAGRFRLLAGRTVPGTRYRIVRWLGEGGMGVVYEAEHMDIERRVALKVLRAELSRRPMMAQVFRNEARAASKIGSPYIVEIYDFGELPDGRLFFCMELVSGHDLVPEHRENRLDSVALITYLRQICKGLGAAHAQGIVHRDIKPENILVLRKDGRDHVKLVDFGIAAFGANQLSRDISGGTPHYMAPEQIAGLPCDGRLDMYSLGCTAYELVTGVPPFEADRLDDLLAKHMGETPRSIADVRGDDMVPPAIEAVILRCLAKVPEDRYRNMADLEAAICEAQLACKLQTPVDDLPLPDVEPDRKARLAELVLAGTPPVGGRRWLWPSLAALSAGLALVVTLYLRNDPLPTGNALAVVDDIVGAAHAAGSRTNYVYPPQDNYLAPTSYLKVLELEALQGELEEIAKSRATDLRTEFAATLVSLGNKYWAHEAARPWAYEYYTQALLFDPNHPTARERNVLSPTALAVLAERARKREFSREELGFTEVVNALAQSNKAQQEAELSALVSKGKVPPLQESLARRALVASRQSDNAGRDHTSTSTAPAPDGAIAAAIPALLPPSDGTADSQRTGAAINDPTRESPRFAPDKQRADELSQRASHERAQGYRKEAERLYHQATGYHPGHTASLLGLSEIYFDEGRYEESVRYAERAVQSSPRNAAAHLQLGDAFFKVLRYRDALAAYATARKLGARKADERVAKVKAKVGDSD